MSSTPATSRGPAVAEPSPADDRSGRPAVTPAPRSHPEAPRPAEPPARRPVLAFGILGVLALIGIGFGVRQWLWGLHHVRTDNAQVEGHLMPVTAKVSGYVTAVPVEENQNVRAGD